MTIHVSAKLRKGERIKHIYVTSVKAGNQSYIHTAFTSLGRILTRHNYEGMWEDITPATMEE